MFTSGPGGVSGGDINIPGGGGEMSHGQTEKVVVDHHSGISRFFTPLLQNKEEITHGWDLEVMVTIHRMVLHTIIVAVCRCRYCIQLFPSFMANQALVHGPSGQVIEFMKANL